MGLGAVTQPLALADETVSPKNPSGSNVGVYLIGPGDVLEILVWKEPELSRTVRVRMDGKISLRSVIEKTSYRPAEILGIPRAGFSVGERADFALYEKIPAPVTPELLHNKCGWTPFEGHLALFPRTVIRGGRVVYRDGEFFKER